MALRHSDRHLDPHGHSHGPRCDELHGRRIATARPQQNKGTRQFADGCPLSYSLICLCDFPNASQGAIDQINFSYVENFANIFYIRFRLIRSLLSPLKSEPVEYESNNPGKRGTKPRVSQPWSDRPSSTSNCTIFSLITSPPIRRTAK